MKPSRATAFSSKQQVIAALLSIYYFKDFIYLFEREHTKGRRQALNQPSHPGIPPYWALIHQCHFRSSVSYLIQSQQKLKVERLITPISKMRKGFEMLNKVWSLTGAFRDSSKTQTQASFMPKTGFLNILVEWFSGLQDGLKCLFQGYHHLCTFPSFLNLGTALKMCHSQKDHICNWSLCQQYTSKH